MLIDMNRLGSLSRFTVLAKINGLASLLAQFFLVQRWYRLAKPERKKVRETVAPILMAIEPMRRCGLLDRLFFEAI